LIYPTAFNAAVACGPSQVGLKSGDTASASTRYQGRSATGAPWMENGMPASGGQDKEADFGYGF